MATPSAPHFALSALGRPLHCLESRPGALSWNLGKRGTRLWASLMGGVAAGATAMFLIRTTGLSQDAVAAFAYLAGAPAPIALHAILASVFPISEDAR